jgi:hypothetical protein
MSASASDDTFLPYGAVRARYGRPARMTFARWLATGELPAPAMRIGSRRFWSLNQLAAHDAKRMKRGVAIAEPERLKRSRDAA